jgi:mannosyltransferase
VSALIPVAWMLIPAVALIASSVVVAVYTPRYLAMCAPAIALLIAAPIDALLGSPRRASAPLAVVALLAIVALIAPVWTAQRGPYAKNYSDWAQISAKLAANARPGDAVAFDDSTRPSRRTRLALHSYPAGFKGLIDVTLKTPYADTSSWYDATYTLAQAQALGRLSTVTRIWVVEYAVPGHVDQTGLATLKAAGFRVTATIRNHRSEIVGLERG